MDKNKKVSVTPNNFYHIHENTQNQIIVDIITKIIFVPPVILILKILGLFSHLSYKSIIIITSVYLVSWLICKLLLVFLPYSPAIKYVFVISMEILVFIIANTRGFSVFIIYILVPVLSCLYLNKKFTYQITAFSYITMIISLIYRAYYVIPTRGFMVTSKEWLISYLIWLTIGYIVFTIFLIVLSRRNKMIIDVDYAELNSNLNAQKTIVSSYVAMLCKKQKNIEGHVKRSAEFVRIICTILQKQTEYSQLFTEDYVYKVISSSLLHDIGIISIPEEILDNKENLNDEEKRMYESHPVLGEKLIKDNMRAIDSDYLSVALDMILYHHENFDGTGYPFKLKGKGIPLTARIMSIANNLDLLMFNKSDEMICSINEALIKIEAMADTILDPDLVEMLLKNKEKIIRMVKKSFKCE